MKIFKKIGIGFLALIICFCSCFKFANAESEIVYLPLPEPFTLENGKYYLFVETGFADDNFACEIFYYYNDENRRGNAYGLDATFNDGDLYLEYNSLNNSYEFPLIYEFTYFQNGQDYYVYSFIVEDVDSQDLSNLYSFDSYSAFITTDNDIPDYSVYGTIYSLIEKFIFGGNIEKGSHQDLTTTTLSSIICVLVFALPFLVIWKVIKVIMG